MNNPDPALFGSAPPKPSIWNDPFYRSLFFQFSAFVVVVLLGKYLFDNTTENMARQGIASGFGFMGSVSGFDVTSSLVEYNASSTYGQAFLVGLLNTLLVSAVSIFLATMIGFVIGIARLSSNWLIAKMATVYIEVLRNIPLLLQIFFWYFAVLQALPSPRQSLSLGEAIFLNVRGLYFPAPTMEPGSSYVIAALIFGVIASLLINVWANNKQRLTGQQTPMGRIVLGLVVGLPLVVYFLAGMPISLNYPELKGFNFRGGISIIPELAALLLALSVYTASFIAEIVRSGINAVSHGQTEAAMSLGLPRSKTLKLVVIPQALRIIIPPLTSQYLNLTKNSSLAMAIGYPDLVSVFAGTTLNQTGQAIEIIAMTMGVYLTLSLITSALMNLYNRKVALVER